MEVQGGQKIVMPGTHLGQFNKNTTLGEGCFVKNENIFASIPGYLNIQKQANNDGTIFQTISVKKSSKNHSPILRIGSIVIGKVIRIKEDSANIKIITIDDVQTKQNLEGIIRRQNVRESEIDKIQMERCFIPGDIVKAKLVSYGDSQKIFLSTAQDDLGVLFGKNQDTQQLMLPYNWQEMICINSGLKEFRKVSKPNFSLFQTEDQ